MHEFSASVAADAQAVTATPSAAAVAGTHGGACARLWAAIERTRDELEGWQRRLEGIGARFAATIRPREEGFTRTVCRITERLVQHHERTPLAGDERSLLGLWIDENLQSLATHPFAPRADLDALSCRWQRHLGGADDPIDVALASLHARRTGTARAGEARGKAGDRGDGPRVEVDAAGAPGTRSGHERRATGAADAAAETAAGAAASVRSPDARLAALTERLFRRLARVLHPDREPDETRRAVKDALMSEALRARDERDLDALMRLHAAHVGALPPDIARDDAALARLLRAQLRTLERRLRRARHPSDALERLIVERYAAEDPAVSEQRFAAHARALDREIERFEELAELIESDEGLREALLGRREIELDRLSIAELTGATR